jgi:hypothetical protein
MLQLVQQRAERKPIGPIPAGGFDFLSPFLDQALAYWNEIRGEAEFPQRADLVPERIVTLWPHMLMVDVIDGGADYFIRLFGQNLVDAYGEQTGRNLSQATAPPLVRERSRLLFDFCLENALPTYAYWPVDASDRRPYVDVEALCLPLSSDGIAPDRMMSLNVNTRSPR